MRILALLLAVLTPLAASCVRTPWANEPIGMEHNMAFTLERNLVELSSLTIDGRPGRFILGTAAPQTIIDPSFAHGRTHIIQFSEKETRRISASPLGLGGVADAIIGADAWQQHAISIDYKSGLVTYQKDGIKPGLMTMYRFEPGAPMIEVEINGARRRAIVDTSSPDTLVLPGAVESRQQANVRIAGINFGLVDVRYDNVKQPRIGNRLLAHFLVTIDYGQRVVGLWHDPRIPVTAAP